MTEEMDEEERMLNDWEDGTPKSFNNAFTEHWDGENSQMVSVAAFHKWWKEQTGSTK